MLACDYPLGKLDGHDRPHMLDDVPLGKVDGHDRPHMLDDVARPFKTAQMYTRLRSANQRRYPQVNMYVMAPPSSLIYLN